MGSIGNAPLGFWMAQQGSIICFVLILVADMFLFLILVLILILIVAAIKDGT